MQKNIIEYLEITAQKYPNKWAYVDQKREISFKNLRDKSRRLAAYLIKHDVVRQNVALLIERDIDALICFYACMYSNNCYVPMDMELGMGRICTILGESGANLLLFVKEDVKEADIEEIETKFSCDINFLFYHGDLQAELKSYEEEEVDELIFKVQEKQISTDPVYMVYTSGSSGKPKGVIANHTNVIDYIDSLGEALGFNEENIFANQSPLYIDACIKDIFSSLKYGATNYIVPKNLFMFPIKLVEFLNENKVNTICWVVSALSIISTMRVFEKIEPKFIHTVAFGGEKFDKKQLSTWMETLPEARFFNLYGPTEATGMSMYYEVQRPFDIEKPLYVGKAFKNTEVFLVCEEDGSYSPAHVNEEGDIYIRGLCVTMGYYNDFERSAQSFVQNPLNNKYREIVYKTGDIGYYDEEGRLVFKGRADNQIKHMGYRIELSEIESESLKQEDVQRVVCLYYNQKIMLFYVGDCTEIRLKAQLAKTLPRYMLPNRLIKLDSMPLTNSGKVDKEFLKTNYK